MNKHMAAIKGGTVTKTNVIGIRKAINHAERLRAGYTGNRSNATVAEVDAIEAALAAREPIVTGELHESGLKVLRNPRYAKRFDSAQRAIIEASDAFFQLVRFDLVDNGMHAVPVYRIIAKGGNFLFRNVSWQTAAYTRDDDVISGPVVVSEESN